MELTFPKEKSGGASNAARSDSNRTGIVVSHDYSVNDALTHWRKEAARLWSEYQRSGNRAHLTAFEVHRAAMAARLATANAEKCR